MSQAGFEPGRNLFLSAIWLPQGQLWATEEEAG